MLNGSASDSSSALTAASVDMPQEAPPSLIDDGMTIQDSISSDVQTIDVQQTQQHQQSILNVADVQVNAVHVVTVEIVGRAGGAVVYQRALHHESGVQLQLRDACANGFPNHPCSLLQVFSGISVFLLPSRLECVVLINVDVTI